MYPSANNSAALLPSSNSVSAGSSTVTLKSNAHSAPSSTPTTCLIIVNSPNFGSSGVGVGVGFGTLLDMKCHSPPLPVMVLHTRFPSPVVEMYVLAIGAITVARIPSELIFSSVALGKFQMTFSAISDADKFPTTITEYLGILKEVASLLNTTV